MPSATPAQIDAAYPVPLVDRQGWKVIDPQAANELTSRIAAEIVATVGCADDVASLAAGAFVNCRTSEGYGLAGAGNVRLASEAQVALSAWIEAKVEELQAAQALRVAA